MAEEFRSWLSGPGSLGTTYAGTDSGGAAIYTDNPDTTWSPPSNLPTTKYGSYADVHPYDVPSNRGVGGFELINHDLWYDDPNYGPITPKWNTIDPSSLKNGYDMIGPIYASILGMAVGIPWYATMGLKAAKYAGGQDKTDPMEGEISAYREGASSLSSSDGSSSLLSSLLFSPGSSGSSDAAETTDLTSLLMRPSTLDELTPAEDIKRSTTPSEESKQPYAENMSSLYDNLQEGSRRLTTLYSLLSSDKKLE